MILRIGTRASALAVTQAVEAANALKKLFPEVQVEVVRIRTRGDVGGSLTPSEPGIFTKDIDLEVLRGRVDLAVHSLKDYPTSYHEDLEISAVFGRISPRDALVPGSVASADKIPQGSVVGTSSMRRISHLKFFRKDLEIKQLRGNVDTRLRRLGQGLDFLVLAEAGLRRLGFRDYVPVDPEIITPQAGQGALALVARKGSPASKLARAIDDPVSRLETGLERSIMASLDAGCRAPLGVAAEALGSRIRVLISIVSPDYSTRVFVNKVYESQAPGNIVGEVVKAFEREGGLEIVREWRTRLGRS